MKNNHLFVLLAGSTFTPGIASNAYGKSRTFSNCQIKLYDNNA
ncbi:MAG: hypothetical protein ACLRQF_02200 [Thomasclavelia ramosa]